MRTIAWIEFLLIYIISALYGLLENNYDQFEITIRSCMDNFMNSRNFKDVNATDNISVEVSGSKIMGTLTTVMFE